MAVTTIPSTLSLDPTGVNLTLGNNVYGGLSTATSSVSIPDITQVTAPDLSNLTSAAPNVGTISGGGAGGSGGLSIPGLGGMNFGLIGAGIGDLFAAGGDKDEENDYKQAASIATQNVAISAESTDIQKTQAQRDIYQTIGSQQAEVAASGTTGGGSAQALLRSSRSQGALQQQQLTVQGQINQNAYKEQAQAYTGEADAAGAAASAATAGGIGSILGGLF
jgi:hypothetical protein